MSLKGSMSMGAAVLLMVGLVAGAIVLTGVISPGTDRVKNATDTGGERAQKNASLAACMGQCRKEYPGDREKYYDCKQRCS